MINEEGIEIVKLQRVAELRTGTSFGELAIMDDVLKPRSATIICDTDCQLALLDRKRYKKILGSAHRRQFMAQVQFIAEIPIFKSFTDHILKSWIYLFDKKPVYSWKHVVYKEGESPSEVYIIRSGQIVCTKMVPIAPSKFEDRNTITLNNVNNKISVTERAPVYKTVKMALLDAGQVFGEEEAFAKFKMERDRELEKDQYGDDDDEKTKAKKRKTKLHQELKKDTAEEILLKNIKTVRETTMTVASLEAEVWSVPAKVYLINISVY